MNIYPSLVIPATAITAGNALIDSTTLNAFVDPQCFIQADYTLSGVTMNISRATGYNFITNPSTSLVPYVGMILKINDGTGKYLTVKALAAGGGESLGDELGLDPGFDDAGDWLVPTGCTISGGKSNWVGVDNFTGMYQQAPTITVVRALYKRQASVVVTSGGVMLRFSAINGPEVTITSTAIFYVNSTVASSNINHLAGASLFTGTVDDSSLKQVTTPSATGVTFTYLSVDSGFNYNATSFTIQVSNGFEAFRDGRSYLELYSAGVLVGKALISKSKSAGESLDSELMRDPAFDDATKWTSGDPSKWAVSGGKATATSSLVSNTLYDSSALPSVGKLCKIVLVCDTFSAGSFANRLTGVSSGATCTSTGTFTDYLTSASTIAGIGVIPNSTLTASFTSLSGKVVLTPVATAALLESAPGVRGWIHLSATAWQNSALTMKIIQMKRYPNPRKINNISTHHA